MIPIAGRSAASLCFMHKWDPELAMQLIERERITSAGGVPTIAWQLIEHPALGKYDLSSLESIGYGGAPAAAELVRAAEREIPQGGAGDRLGHDRNLGRASPGIRPKTTSCARTAAARHCRSAT